MINKFENLPLLGKSMGKMSYVGPEKVGKAGDVRVAQMNINGSLDTVKITPQGGFDFNQPMMTEMKLINAYIAAGDARSNSRSGSRVATFGGFLFPMNSPENDMYPDAEYDALYVTGKDKRVVGKVRSASAFDKKNLVLFSVETNYKTNQRGEVTRDADTDEPIVSNIQFNFVPKDKAFAGGVTEDDYIRILSAESVFLQMKNTLKLEMQLIPNGLKFAFVGNDTTDWTVYADSFEIPAGDAKPVNEAPKVEEKPNAPKADDKQNNK
ncbi:hypothetical protein H9L19_04680 [Weissella diestrammenae]|uniref:Uncharacterized protein n=1 Tax=Weissella diestrammenae TaxID=1162633 RepID=A0A7G9T3P4_9LACO|nr:hypothetical protein [Weissella diestrammenae]MCM0582701.1 hypothetical protein [Weissella diestrammenae]QNN74719.1 hypothetical protein H9L19_04680 [Weissella diestrammenae]